MVHPARCSEHPPVGHGSVATERNRYFTGKSMAAREFIAEQRYFLSHHRLHNRLLHGWGIVCGLTVVPHPVPECQDRWVVVKAGVALDCYGRELVVHEDTPVRFRPDPPASPAGGGAGQQAPDKDTGWKPPPGGLLVCLRYREDQVEPVPAYDEACDPERTESNRVREVASIKFVPFQEVGPGCWRSPDAEPSPCQHDDCNEEAPGPAAECLDPERSCPCGACVPLARLVFGSGDNDEQHPNPSYRIDDDGVWRVQPPPGRLTHITKINWTHGGNLPIRELERRLTRELRVYFDRPLKTDGGNATGINRFTFKVQHRGSSQALEFLRSDPSPRFVEDKEEGCYAVFTIDEDHFEDTNINGDDVYVTLECDFILDCLGNPVDGDHLHGVRPTGSGTPGGTFKSWFHIGRREP